MCSIAGFINELSAVERAVVLQQLEAQGGHGTGAAYLTQEGWFYTKRGDKLLDVCADEAFQQALASSVALFHLRRASGGLGVGSRASDENAHPFHRGKVTLAHNGSINNWQELAKQHFPDDNFNVDSDLMAAMINRFGNDAFKEMRGWAGAWWLHDDDTNAIYRYVDGATVKQNASGTIFTSAPAELPDMTKISTTGLVERYDLESRKWETIGEFPLRCDKAVVVSLGRKFNAFNYGFGAWEEEDGVWDWDGVCATVTPKKGSSDAPKGKPSPHIDDIHKSPISRSAPLAGILGHSHIYSVACPNCHIVNRSWCTRCWHCGTNLTQEGKDKMIGWGDEVSLCLACGAVMDKEIGADTACPACDDTPRTGIFPCTRDNITMALADLLVSGVFDEGDIGKYWTPLKQKEIAKIKHTADMLTQDKPLSQAAMTALGKVDDEFLALIQKNKKG